MTKTSSKHYLLLYDLVSLVLNRMQHNQVRFKVTKNNWEAVKERHAPSLWFRLDSEPILSDNKTSYSFYWKKLFSELLYIYITS